MLGMMSWSSDSVNGEYRGIFIYLVQEEGAKLNDNV